MSKYIIEIPDDVPYVLLRREEYGKFITKVVPVSELEELNSDYINEHYGELQDEAYQRGHDDGYEAGCATAFKPVSDAEYQRGLAEGKKAFDLLDAERDAEYQKGFEDGKKSTEKGCEGCKYEHVDEGSDPCCICAKGYIDHYEPAPHSDRIEVGDEEPCIINEQTRQALNSAISALAEAMDRIREKLEVFND